MNYKSKRIGIPIGICFLTLSCLFHSSFAGDNEFIIEEAVWDKEKERITIKGKGQNGKLVTVYNAGSDNVIGTDEVDDEKWRVQEYNPATVPCNVKAVQEDGRTDEKRVKDAPDNCDDGGANPPPDGGLTGNFTILAANDLGMHCADQDFRVFSILPPYNVLNAQVLRKGGEPQMMSPADGVYVTYKAVNSNYFVDLTDPTRLPDAVNSVTSTGTNLPGVFKNNFWETASAVNGVDTIGFIAYDPLYPGNETAKLVLNDPLYPYGVLSLFSSTADLGLPAPDVVELWLGGGALHAEQSLMPGLANVPQPFHGFVEDFPFFVTFENAGFPTLGYTVNNFKRYTAEGVPISAIDDIGRSNPYPVMRIEARDANDKVLASVDAVVPVASEADCAICHASQTVCNFDDSKTLICDDIANFNYPAVTFVEGGTDPASGDPILNVIGATKEQKVINGAKINILRLHDAKHLTSLDGTAGDGSQPMTGSTKNIVCASCHYSPALDLAHLGPNDDNGKEQTQHISMSRAMHGVHGALATNPDYDGYDLFPTMPPPGPARDPMFAEKRLMETCYNCHPGKNAKCLRGAMGGSGTVCQDCHGQMTQVGDDFSEGFPTSGFPDGADSTKRVPWASEPACDSCHVGDVMQTDDLNLTDVVVNATDIDGNADGLRLLQSYKLTDHIDHGGPTNLPILKFPDSRFATTEALYRLSGANNGTNQGHGGLSCEGCHGSTHAIWPNINPNANDNKAANDLQGHSGTIIECSTCHEGDLGNTLEGPHGMHPVGDTNFSDGGHEGIAEQNNGDSCRACHGLNGEGSVLSRAATDRTLSNEGSTISLIKGEVVTCTLCHDNEL